MISETTANVLMVPFWHRLQDQTNRSLYFSSLPSWFLLFSFCKVLEANNIIFRFIYFGKGVSRLLSINTPPKGAHIVSELHVVFLSIIEPSFLCSLSISGIMVRISIQLFDACISSCEAYSSFSTINRPSEPNEDDILTPSVWSFPTS